MTLLLHPTQAACRYSVCRRTFSAEVKRSREKTPHIQFLNFYRVLYSRIAIILTVSLCLKGEGRRGVSCGCWEKHRPEKIHFNLPNASAGLLTFSNWYFPWNPMVSLHNSIIEPHLIGSDYTQRDCSHRESWVYISQTTQTSENLEGLDRQTDAVHLQDEGGTNKVCNFLLHLTKQTSGLCRDFPKGVIC